MPVAQALLQVRQLYTENVRRSGATSTAVGWNTPESQALRFQKLTTLVDPGASAFTVNDYGCGYGAHLQYLLRHGYDVAAYYGYDVSGDMLATAREQAAPFAGVLELREGTLIETVADYTFVSGTFNVRFGSDDGEWTAFIVEKLAEIHRHSRRGFSFNLLSTYVDWKQPHLYYGDPLFWFDHCKRHFSRFVSLLHDYPLYEWTIVVRK